MHSLPTFIFLFFSLVHTCIANLECLPEQRSLLIQLKQNFTFPSYKLVSWQPGSNCCNWDGVTCDYKSGRVISLDLSMHNLSISGSVGDSLFNLTSLENLNLAYNQFGPVPLPSGFERLVNLTRLNLSHTGFIGQIPIEFCKLTKLVSLDLSGSCDDDAMTVQSLQLENPNLGTLTRNFGNLKELHLDCVSIFGGIDWYEMLQVSLPLLQVLSLKNSNLSGVLPQEIFQHRELNVLDLSNNQMLSGPVPKFPKNSTMQSLLLSNTNLSGNLTESIGNLKFLRTLHLSGCQFTGQIPNSLGTLSQLVHLDLSHNSFIGAIPMLHLPSLQELYLDHNQLSGRLEEFPITSSLRSIDLNNNQLQGQIPVSLFQLSSLQYLGLASNNFSGILRLNLFYRLSSLNYLDLSHNNLLIVDGEVNSSISLPILSTLKLASCSLMNIPSLLTYQDRITTLDLSNNRITGEIPKWLWHIGNETLMSMNLSYNLFTHVEASTFDFNYTSDSSPIVVDLSSNMLQGPIPLPPKDTILLDYSNNNFSSVIPFNISFYLNSTIFFSLANNSLTGEIPLSICHVRSLQVLDLSDNFLSGPIPSCILKHSKDLIVLNLRGNKLQGSIPQRISKRCGLKTLNLNGNYLEGGVPLSLVNCNELEVIDFGNNHLVDVFPFWLGNIYVLRILVLRSNGFHGTIELPPWIPHNSYTLTKLQILDVSSNQFSGRLPPDCFPNLKAMTVKSQSNSSVVGEFVYPELNLLSPQGLFYQDTVVVTSKGRDSKLIKILTIFNYIDFSNNRFEGDIPDVIGGLHSLYVLNFSHNELTGQIPSTFGNLTQLESLDLSANHLSGEIPQELTSLTFLSVLNLSNNNLEGSIPQDNQFSTFTNTSYQGNKGLCGIPLSKQCNNASPARTDTEAASSESDHESSDLSYDLGLALSVGLGYGLGFALIFVIQTMGFPARKWEKLQQWLLVLRRRG